MGLWEPRVDVTLRVCASKLGTLVPRLPPPGPRPRGIPEMRAEEEKLWKDWWVLVILWLFWDLWFEPQTGEKVQLSPLHMKLQVTYFQRCEHTSHQRLAWVTPQLNLCFLLLMILQLYHLPPPLPPLVNNSSCLFTWWEPLCASCCTVLIHFSGYCTVGLKMLFYFVCLFVMYFLCEKYDKPTTEQWYIANYASWVPMLTLLDLQIYSLNRTCSLCRGLTVMTTRN